LYTTSPPSGGVTWASPRPSPVRQRNKTRSSRHVLPNILNNLGLELKGRGVWNRKLVIKISFLLFSFLSKRLYYFHRDVSNLEIEISEAEEFIGEVRD